MKRFRAFFRGLGWKLTLSYTLVTVGALLVAELIVLVALLSYALSPELLPSMAAQAIVADASQLYPFLDENPPDINGIQSWLVKAAVTGFGTTNSSGTQTSFSPGFFTQRDGQMIVLDSLRKILVVVPENASLIGRPFDWAGQPDIDALLSAAYAGEKDYTHLFYFSPARKVTIAAPIIDPQQKVVGILLVSGTIFPESQPYDQVVGIMGGSLVFFTVAAGAVGTVFGFLTARGLTSRLRHVSQAADSWSHGDFTAAIPDRSGDELGDLARRLNHMSEQLQYLMQTRQELATLEERNRLARDLHDSVKQEVFATVMQVGAARELIRQDPAAAEARLEEAERLSRQAQQELTALIRELRPATLEGKGLTKALREYLADWEKQTGIRVDFRLQGQRSLPLVIEQNLFRVIQEALSNIVRHSGASAIELHLAWETDCVVLNLTDNGHGFDPTTAAGKGIGLQSMHERVENLGGQFDIHTNPEGTQLEISIPIQKLGV